MPEAARIYVGTSGWSYPRGEGAWTGHFYPAGKINELEYYSQFFKTVEVNSSFYRPPSPSYVHNWIKRVPPDFLFNIKLWQKFTHPAMFEKATGEAAAISPADVEEFHRSIEPLAAAGKLGVLLAQFPPSFKNDDHGRQILAAIIRTFGKYRLTVELRHRSWSDDPATASQLGDNNVSWAHIDEPKFPTSVAAELPQTADTAYFRFHGRNRDDWWQGDAETRYRYLYPPEELQELATRVRAAIPRVKYLFALFNNHWQGYAPRNAVDLLKALQLPFRELPMTLPATDEKPPQLF